MTKQIPPQRKTIRVAPERAALFAAPPGEREAWKRFSRRTKMQPEHFSAVALSGWKPDRTLFVRAHVVGLAAKGREVIVGVVHDLRSVGGVWYGTLLEGEVALSKIWVSKGGSAAIV